MRKETCTVADTADEKREYFIRSDDGRIPLAFRRAFVAAFRRTPRRHHHADFEIAVFKSGSGVYTVGGVEYGIRPGDIFLFSTDEVHCITEIHGEGIEYSMIHFSPSFIWGQHEKSGLHLLKVFFNRSVNFTNRIDRNNPSTAKIASLVDEIGAELEKAEPEYELMVYVRLAEILILLERDYGYVDESAADIGAVNAKSVEKALAYIDGNLDSALTLEKIAAEAGMNKTYFSTLFKKLNGMSPWEYITVRRIERAVSLLKTTDMSILETALVCGYNNTANFNRAFRKITGKVPSEMRVGRNTGSSETR